MSDVTDSAAAKPFRTVVEERIIGHLEKIKEVNKLESLEKVHDFLIENWYMYDAHWLAMVDHMYRHGRVQ